MAVKEFVLVVKYDVATDEDLGEIVAMLQARVKASLEDGTDDPAVRDVIGRLSGPS